MKVYKVLHVPTGLFYRNKSGMYGAESNLGVTGKIYNRESDAKNAATYKQIIHKSKSMKVGPLDLKVICYDLVECNEN
jgi:hypothetical protein